MRESVESLSPVATLLTLVNNLASLFESKQSISNTQSTRAHSVYCTIMAILHSVYMPLTLRVTTVDYI